MLIPGVEMFIVVELTTAWNLTDSWVFNCTHFLLLWVVLFITTVCGVFPAPLYVMIPPASSAEILHAIGQTRPIAPKSGLSPPGYGPESIQS